MRQIKVLVVEDSLLYSGLLVKALSSDPAIEVVGAATDPYQARDMLIKYKPDVMTLDIELPRMDGIEFLRKLMPQYPIPTVMVSSLSDKVFDALNAGAVDFVEKPHAPDHEQMENFLKNELPLKIKIASTARIGAKRKLLQPGVITMGSCLAPQQMIVAIGASTGGPEAITTVLSGFPADIPGTVIVQHMPPGFTGMFAKRLNEQCAPLVTEAEDGDIVEPGHVLIAPSGDRQLQVVSRGGQYRVECRKGEKVNGHCPSVDVMFHSVAKAAGKQAVGVILTGMGGDGAQGLLAMRQAGAHTVGQDPSTCVVYGMPRVAYEAGAVEFQEKLSDIPDKVCQVISKMQKEEKR